MKSGLSLARSLKKKITNKLQSEIILRFKLRLRERAFYRERAKKTCIKSGHECCIALFGLNRALGKTASSINLNIKFPLLEYGLDTISAAHFNCPHVIYSPRSREFNVIAKNNQGLDELNCQLTWLEPQTESNIRELASRILQYPLRHERDPEGVIRKNALHQMYSQKRLLSLLYLLGIERFKIFCLARADLLYLDPITDDAISSIINGETDVLTPSWHKWGGFNDRFALCSRKGAEVYLSRLNWVEQFCNQKGYFHPEEILRFSVEQSGLKFGFITARARRMRSTGAVMDEDWDEDVPI